MNEALDMYANENSVMHVSAHIHPLDNKLPKTFFYNVNSCWGWGTWDVSWSNFERDPVEIKRKLLDSPDFSQKKFNRGQGNAFWDQIEANISGGLCTWAIYWHSAIFLNNGFSLHPGISLVKNIGMDNSGVHCGKSERYLNQQTTDFIDLKRIDIKEDPNITKLMEIFRNKKPQNTKPVGFVRFINKILRQWTS